MQRLGARRFAPGAGLSQEQARELAVISHGLSRQIGLMIDRQGRVAMILVGEPDSVYIPELPRQREGAGRLRGLRLLHTHLRPDTLDEEDLTDLLFLRLDDVAVLALSDDGFPRFFQHAHLRPLDPTAAPPTPASLGEEAAAPPPYTVSDPVPWSEAGVDYAAQTQALEEEFARLGAAITGGSGGLSGASAGEGGRALLVSVGAEPQAVMESRLAELADLAETAGLEVAGRITQRVRSLNPKFILGKGKLADLETRALSSGAGVIVFDRELAPTQLRNLAQVTERKILDRTQLILDIFAQRARTRAGRLQVELAQLSYTLPRLKGQNKAFSRLMGGIGGRGPGETKLEVDRRRVRERMTHIRAELGKLRKRRAATRARRAKSGVPVVALVGYTNAGKSTLLNRLTRSEVLAEDKLFATLDPTTRRLRLPYEREIILTDTVGFIRELPGELVEAFRATLEELEEADLLVHVADAAHPEVEDHIRAVQGILGEMDLSGVSLQLVFNKIDRVEAAERELIARYHPGSLQVSAATGEGLEDLARELADRLAWESKGAQTYGEGRLPAPPEWFGPTV